MPGKFIRMTDDEVRKLEYLRFVLRKDFSAIVSELINREYERYINNETSSEQKLKGDDHDA